MSRPSPSSLLATALVVASVACSSAPERHDPIPMPATDASTSAQTCELVPGEDACNRFQVLTPTTRAAIAYNTRYAGDVQAALRALEAGCIDMIVELDVRSRPVVKGGPRERALAMCSVAFDALVRERPEDLTANVGARDCHGAPIPTCIVEQFDHVWETCLPPAVEVHTADEAFGVALQRSLPALMATSDTMRSLEGRSSTARGELSWAVDAQRNEEIKRRAASAPRPPKIEFTCLVAASDLHRAADADLEAAASITKRLRTVLKLGERP